jgi:hypothetical protein
MNERALTLARWYNILPNVAMNCLHVYNDGYVVVVDGPADRHLLCREALKDTFPGFEEARSPSNDFSVFVVPDQNVPDPKDLEDEINPYLGAMTMMGGCKDHREEDYDKINATVDLATRTLKAAEKLPGGTLK